MRHIFNLDNLLSTLFIIAILKFLPYMFQIDFLNPIENTLEDFQISDIVFSQLPFEETPMDSNIVLVNIGLLNRKGIAMQVELINRFGPKVIGIDSFFRRLKGDEVDDPLDRAFSKVDNLVLVSELIDYNDKKQYWDTLYTSHRKFNRHALNGYANFIVREENYRTVRNFTPVQSVDGKPHLAFGVEVARIFDSTKAHDLIEYDRGEEVIINFRRNTEKYPTLDAMEVFRRRDDLEFVRDKIVLMGFMGPDIISPTNEDMFFTPLNSRYVGKNYPDMYGVVVHANIISMIMDGKYLYSLPYWVSTVATVLLIYLNMAMYSYLRARREGWYEAISLSGTFAQMIIVFLIILGCFYYFRTEIHNAGVFFALILTKQGYETFNDSLKPLLRDLYIKRIRAGVSKVRVLKR